MGVFGQLRLMLWKALLQRWRQPVVLCLEIIWPIAIFLIVVLVRRGAPPTTETECFYAPRAMPSTGLPFIQSTVCNLDTQCKKNSSEAVLIQNAQMATFLEVLGPLRSDVNATRVLLAELPVASRALKQINDIFKDPEVRKMLGMEYRVGDLFLDERLVRMHLLQKEYRLSESTVDSLLNAHVNVSKIFEWSGYVDFKGVACDPDQLASYLILPKRINVAIVSNQLCAINNSQIPNIAEALQKQIDVATIIKLISQIEGVLGNYTQALLLEDVATMAELLLNLPSLNLADTQHAVAWLVRASDIYLSLQDGRVDPHLIRMLANDIGPVLEALTGNATWWQALKQLLASAAEVSRLLTNSRYSLNDLSLTLRDLIGSDSIWNEILKGHLNQTSELIALASSGQIDVTRLSEEIPRLVSGDVYGVLCEDPGVAALIVYANRTQQLLANDMQRALCAVNNSLWNETLAATFDFSALLEKIDKIKHQTYLHDLDQFNWTQLISQGEALYRQLSGDIEHLATVVRMRPDGLGSIWAQFADAAQSIAGSLNPASNQSLADLLKIAGNLHNLAALNPASAKNLSYVYRYANVFMDFLEEMSHQIIELGAYLWQHNTEFEGLVSELVEADPELLWSLALAGLSPDNLLMLAGRDDGVEGLVCDETQLRLFLSPHHKDNHVNVTQLRSILCRPHIIKLLNGIVDLLDVNELEEKLRYHINAIIVGYNATSDPQPSPEETYQRSQAIIEKLTAALRLNDSTWEKVNLRLEAMFPSGYRWQELSQEVQTLYATIVTRTAITTVGPMFENSTNWSSFGPYFHIGNLYVSLISSSLQLYSDMLSTTGETNRMWYLGIHYGPDLILALSQALNDSATVDELLEREDWASLLCDEEDLANLLSTLPEDVPLAEIQKSWCPLLQMAETWTNFSREQSIITEKIVAIYMDPSVVDGMPFDWDVAYANMWLMVDEMGNILTKMLDPTAGMDTSWVDELMKMNMTKFMQAISQLQNNAMDPQQLTRMYMKMMGLYGGMGKTDYNIYYTYTINQFVVEMNDRMAEVQEGEVTFGNLVSDGKMADAVDALMASTPEILKSLQEAVISPEQMALMLIKPVENLCDGGKLNDVITFSSDADVDAIEDVLCAFNDTTRLLQEMQSELFMIKSFNKMINQMMTYDPELVPANFTEDQMNVNMGKLVDTLQNMVMKATLAPPLNVTRLLAVLSDMGDSMNPDDMIQGLTRSLDDLITSLSTGNDSVVWHGMMGYFHGTVTYLRFVNSLMQMINASETVYIDELLNSAEISRLLRQSTSSNNSLEIMKAFTYNIALILMQPGKVAQVMMEVDRLMNFCNDSSVAEQILELPPDSPITARQLQSTFCQTANFDYELALSQLRQAHPYFDEYLKIVLGETEVPAVNLSAYTQVYTAYTQYLTGITNTPRTYLLYRDFTWMESDSWDEEDFLGMFSNLANISMADIAGIVQDKALTDWLTAVLADSQSRQSLQIMMVLGEVSQTIAKELDTWAGRNVSLVDVFPDSPVTQRLLGFLDHIPVLYEVWAATSTQAPSKLSRLSRDVSVLCEPSQRDAYLVVKESSRQKLYAALDDLCQFNYTLLIQELGDTFYPQLENVSSSSNMTVEPLASSLTRLYELISKVPRTRWIQDYSWFHNTNWTSALAALVENSMNPPRIEESIRQAMESTFASIMDPDILAATLLQYNTIADAMIKQLELWAGRNVSLTDVFSESPETLKLLKQLGNLPLLYETLVKTAVSSSQQMSYLLSGNLICNTTVRSSILIAPVDKQQQLDAVFDQLCAVNLTIVLAELSDSIPMETVFNATADPNVTATLDKFSRLYQLMDLVQDTKWVQDYSWFNAINWTSPWMTDSPSFTDTTSTMRYLSQMLQAFVDSEPSAFQWMHTIDVIVTFMEAISQDPGKLLSETQELHKLAELSKWQQDIVQMLVTSFMYPEKVRPVTLALQENPMSLCNMTDLQAYLTLPENSTLNITVLQSHLCKLNVTAATIEANQIMQDISKQLLALGKTNETSPPNVTAILLKVGNLQMKLTALMSNNDTWRAVFEMLSDIDIETWMIYTGDFGIDTKAEDLTGLISTLDILSQGITSNDVTPQLENWSAALDILTSKIELLINGSNIRPRDLFPGSPNVQKLADLFEDTPAIFSLVSSSYGTPQFAAVLEANMTAAFIALCTGDVTRIITRPATVSEDELLDLQHRFCDLNLQMLAAEFEVEFNTDKSSNQSLSMSSVYKQYLSMRAAYSALLASPPTLDSNLPWMNASEWLQAFGNYAESSNMPQQSLDAYKLLMEMFTQGQDPHLLLGNRIMADILATMNSRLGNLVPGQLTLNHLLPDTPKLREFLLNSLEFLPDTIEAILHITVTKPEKLQEFIDKLLKYEDKSMFICNQTEKVFGEMFDFPATVNVSWWFDLCDANETVIMDEVLRLLGLDRTLSRLESYKSSGNITWLYTNWTEYFLNNQGLGDKITAMILSGNFSLKLPAIDEKRIIDIFNNAVSGTNFSNIDDVIRMNEGLMNLLYAQNPNMSYIVNRYLDVSKILMDYVNKVIQLTNLERGTVNIEGLFADSTQLLQLINRTLGFDADYAMLLSQITIRPDQLLLLLTDDSIDFAKLACEPDQITRYFSIPDGVDIEKLSDALCSINISLLLDEFSQQLSVQNLIAQLGQAWVQPRAVNISELMKLYNELVANIMVVSNVSYLDAYQRALAGWATHYNLTMLQALEMPAIWKSLQGGASDPMSQDQLEMYVRTLEQLEDSIANTSFGVIWRQQVIPAVAGAQVFMQVARGNLADLPEVNVTLADFMKDSPLTQEFLAESLAMSPEIVAALLSAQVNFTQLIMDGSGADVISVICSDVTSFPGTVNASVVHFICAANYSAISMAINEYIGLPYITQQVAKWALANSTDTFNWTSYFQDAFALNTELTEYFKVARLPSLSTFFLYDGDWTSWLTALNKAMSTPQQNTDQWVADMLDSIFKDKQLLEPLVPYLSAIQDLIASLRDSVTVNPGNLTLKDVLLQQTETYRLMERLLEDSPGTLEALMYSNVDLQKLMALLSADQAVGVAELFCSSDAVKYASEADRQRVTSLLCNTSFDAIVSEMRDVLNWNTLIDAFVVMNSSVPTGPFNWTSFLSDITWLQQNVSPDIYGVQSLAAFWPKGMMDYNWASLFDSENVDIAKILNMSFEALAMSLEGYDSVQSRQISHTLSALAQSLDVFLGRVLSDSELSIGDLVSNTTQLHRILSGLLRPNSTDYIRALLTANIDPTTLVELLTSDNLTASTFCTEPLSGSVKWNSSVDVDVDDFQDAICRLNTSVLVQQLLGHIDVAQVIAQLQKSQNNWNSTGMPSLRGDFAKITKLIESLIRSPATVNDDFTAWLNTSALMSLLEKMMVSEVTAYLQNTGIALIERYLNDTSMGELAATAKVITEWLNENTGSTSDVGAIFSKPSVFIGLVGRLLSQPTILSYVMDDAAFYNMLAPHIMGPMYGKLGTVRDINDLVCNDTVLRAITSDVDPAVLRNALCNRAADEWIERLFIEGLSYQEVQDFFTSLARWTYKNDTNVVLPAVDEILSANIQYFIDGLSTLLKMTNSSIDLSWLDPTQITNSLKELPGGNPEAVFKMIDEIMTNLDGAFGHLEEWQSYKEKVHMAYLVTRFITDNADTFNGENGTMDLLTLMTNMNKFNVLQTTLTSQTMAALLTATIDPNILHGMADQSDMVILLCNRTRFSTVVMISDATNLPAVQSELCDAAKKDVLTRDVFATLLDFKILYEELSKPAEVPDNLWELLTNKLATLYGLSANANFSLFHMLEGFKNPDQWDGSMDTICMDYVSSFDALFNSQLGENMFVNVQPWLEWTTSVIRTLPDIESHLCGMEHTNLTDLYNQIRHSDLVNTIMEVPMNNKDQSVVNCSQLVRAQQELQKTFSTIWPRMSMSLNSTLHCVANTAGKQLPALMELQGIFDLLLDATELMGSINDDVKIKVLEPFIQVLLNTVMQQKPVWVKFADVFTNGSQTLEGILRGANVSPAMLDALLRSSFDINLLPGYNFSEEAIKAILCDPVTLSKWLRLPTDVVADTTKLSHLLCDEDVDKTVEAIINAVNSRDIFMQLVQGIQKYSFDDDWVRNISGNVERLGKDIDSLLSFLDATKEFDTDNLLKMLPSIQQFLVDNKPDQMFNDFNAIIESIKSKVDDDTAGNLLGDLQIVANGIRGLNVLNRFLPQNVQLQSLLKSPSIFRAFMVDELGMDPEVAQALLESSVSFVQLFNVSSDFLASHVCEADKLGSILLFNDTQLAALSLNTSVIGQELCALDRKRATAVTQYLTEHINIGSLVKNIVAWSPDEILRKANVTKDDLRDVSANLKPLNSQFNNVFTRLGNLTIDFDPADVMQAFTQEQKATSAVNSLGELVCGRKNALDVDDSYNLEENLNSNNIRNKRDTSPGSTNSALKKDIPLYDQLEMDGLKTQFCKDVYLEIVKTDTGRLVWNYLKPLLLGKIPYSPDTAVTAHIMKEALGVFDYLHELQDLSRALIDGVDNLNQLVNDTYDIYLLEEAFSNPFVSSAIADLMGVDARTLLEQLQGLSDFDQNDVDTIYTLAQIADNFTDCIELDRLEPFANEEEMTERSLALSNSNRILAGVVFLLDEDEDGNRTRRSLPNLPKHIRYKIRMDIEQVPSTTLLKSGTFTPGPEDDVGSDMRYLRGFVQLQDLIDRAIIKLQTAGKATLPITQSQLMPFPCYVKDDFKSLINRYVVPVVMIISWLVAVANGIRVLVYDREKGTDQTMLVMGLRPGVRWMSWFINTFVSMLIMSVVIVLFLYLGNLMPYSDPSLIFVLFACFSLAITMMCYMLSAFFNRATLASLSAVMVYLLCYLPFILLVAMGNELEGWHINLLCLSAPTSFSYACMIIADLEVRGPGASWSNLFNYGLNSNDFYLGWAGGMMLIDAAIYALIGWYFSHVFPGTYGMSQPWYFPVSPTFWGCKKRNVKSPNKYKFRDFESNTYDDEKPELQAGMGKPINSSVVAKAEPLSTTNQRRNEGPGERDPDNLPIGISVHHLQMIYKDKIALEDLSVNIFQEQVTALLGHNGAGKTTALNLLTGIHEPSSGTAFIDGISILSDTTSRKHLGFCPQHDTLFDDLTVYEHLDFYACLKSSGSKKLINQAISEMLDNVGLRPSENVKVSQLSGGQKRRLSVAIAFIGDSKTIVLDEPTSGVDSCARRSIWDLIASYQKGRTILLSTHYLDEADIVGDRIVVLHRGKLVVTGSPLFLKTEYGSGYELVVDKGSRPVGNVSGADSQENSRIIQDFVTNGLGGSQLIDEIGSEMKFALPSSKRQAYAEFFTALEHAKEKLHIVSFGVSDTTLEEVFLKLIVWCDQKRSIDDAEALRNWRVPTSSAGGADVEEISLDSGVEGSSGFSESQSGVESTQTLASRKSGDKVKGVSLKIRQFWALIVKRFHHNRRDYRSYLSQIILPCLFVCLAMAFTSIKPKPSNMPSLMLTPELYVHLNGSAVSSKRYISYYRMHGHGAASSAMTDSLFEESGVGTACMQDFHTGYSCDGQSGPWVNPNASKSFPAERPCSCTEIGVQCPADATTPITPYWRTNGDFYIHDITGINLTTNEFLLRSRMASDINSISYGGWEFSQDDDDDDVEATVWYHSKGWHTLPAYYNAYSNMVLRGNLDSAQKTMAGQYGITTYNHPLPQTKEQLGRQTLVNGIADTGIALCILCAFCFVPAGLAIYVISERISYEKRLQYTCGVGATLYWITAIIWDMLSYAITLGIAVAIAAAFQLSTYTAHLNLLAFAVSLWLFGWATIPIMYLVSRHFKEAATGYMLLFVINFFLGVNTTACIFLLGVFADTNGVIEAIHDKLQYIFLIFPQFCLGDALVKLAHNQLLADVYERFNIDSYVDPFSFEMLGWNLVAMAVASGFFLILVMIVECQCCVTSRRWKKVGADYKEDSDVGLERQRIQSKECMEDLLVLQGLRKEFRRGLRKVVAVDNLTLGVPRSECFGLLGVNGAGKTTTFNMVTGEIVPTRGAAKLRNNIISTHQPDMKQDVGYCPQFSALDLLLSVRECLVLYARLKGIPSSDIRRECDEVTRLLGLEQYEHQVMKNLSGGTQRKLSAAVALLGHPSIILMDEPTTGMDVQTRRLVWTAVNKVIRDQRSVIFTSHSLSECEALCTRIAIMVNGKAVCLGSAQHIKDKFGQGYTVTIRVKDAEAGISPVIHYMKETFPGAALKDQHMNVITIEVPIKRRTVADLFGQIELNKESLAILDYSVSQTTLDQIFINFARAQNDGMEEERDAEAADIDYMATSRPSSNSQRKKNVLAEVAIVPPPLSPNAAANPYVINTSQSSLPTDDKPIENLLQPPIADNMPVGAVSSTAYPQHVIVEDLLKPKVEVVSPSQTDDESYGETYHF